MFYISAVFFDMKIIGPITQLLTMENLPMKGSISDEKLQIINDAAIIVSEGKIVKTGNFEMLCKEFPKAEIEQLQENCVVIPGFIDCHTHICFAGSRAQDFAMRNAGKSYLEIAQQGGGIWSSVTHTRNATEAELSSFTLQRANKHFNDGITTMEIKSGYGLDKENELKMLQAIANANEYSHNDLISTCLSAHIKPKDFIGNTEEYLQFVLNEILPEAKKYTNRVDIFIEKTAFGNDEAKLFLQKAKALGFQITVHADQFTSGSSLIAVEVGAVSADHLEASTNIEIKVLAKSETVAVALPGASIGLGEPFTPARKLLDNGACLAIASDWNPGSAPQGDLLMQASILATYQKLSTAEVFAALTYRAAKALQLYNRGILKENSVADFQLYETDDYREILYHQGTMKPKTIWKSGINCK